MSKAITLFCWMMLFSPLIFAQEALRKSAEQQASAMAAAYAKGDYLTMARFTHKKVVDMLGGPQKMATALHDKMAELSSKGVTLISVETGPVMQMVQTPAGGQCIIPQDVRMAADGKKVYSRTHLLGISTDKGKTWTFLDANGQTPAMLHGLIPDLRKEIVIPEKQIKAEEPPALPDAKKQGENSTKKVTRQET